MTEIQQRKACEELARKYKQAKDSGMPPDYLLLFAQQLFEIGNSTYMSVASAWILNNKQALERLATKEVKV